MNGSVGQASVQRLLRLLATAGAALVLVVIVSSAYLRLGQAGLSCADWPACYGRIQPAGEATLAQRGARIAHRFAASAVGAALLALTAVAAVQRPRLTRQAAIAGAGLAVAAGLATIGAVSSESASATPLPAVTIANLGGGFALLALMGWLRQTTLDAGAPDVRNGATRPWLGALAALALASVIGQILLGALVSAKYAALACPAFPLCGADAPPGSLLAVLDPLTALAVDASGAIVRPDALASLHWAHRVGAHVVLALAAVLAVALIRSDRARPYAIALAALVVLEISLGATSVLTHFKLPVVLAHNLTAALLLTVLVAINDRLRAAQGPA
ncbi:MAG TPA: COX15/CtaA family protein [Casimicrobiaceae bacterium]